MDGVVEAGRELDALVAERVMGLGSQWTVQLQPDGTFKPTGEVSQFCPEYSTDIEAMIGVINHFKGRYWWQGRTPFSDGDEHMAGFTQFGATGWNGRPDYQGFGMSLPHATALAALQIDEGEERQEFADAVRHGRKEQGVALHELAQRLGWGIPRVSEIERGVGEAPTVEEREELLAALGIDAATPSPDARD